MSSLSRGATTSFFCREVDLTQRPRVAVITIIETDRSTPDTMETALERHAAAQGPLAVQETASGSLDDTNRANCVAARFEVGRCSGTSTPPGGHPVGSAPCPFGRHLATGCRCGGRGTRVRPRAPGRRGAVSRRRQDLGHRDADHRPMPIVLDAGLLSPKPTCCSWHGCLAPLKVRDVLRAGIFFRFQSSWKARQSVLSHTPKVVGKCSF